MTVAVSGLGLIFGPKLTLPKFWIFEGQPII